MAILFAPSDIKDLYELAFGQLQSCALCSPIRTPGRGLTRELFQSEINIDIAASVGTLLMVGTDVAVSCEGPIRIDVRRCVIQLGGRICGMGIKRDWEGAGGIALVYFSLAGGF